MAIILHYRCSSGSKDGHACLFRTGVLQDAQAHANNTGHALIVSGTLTSSQPTANLVEIEKSAAEKARELVIMRKARERGLV